MNRAQLEADVCQSQTIEHIQYNARSELSQAHYEATQIVWDEVSAGRWPDVRALHSVLMKPSDLDLPCKGAWRTWGVYVGNKNKPKTWRHMPNASHVANLMDEWEGWCEYLLHKKQSGILDEEHIETYSDVTYYWYLCVHPFADGNGRTGRLMRNAMRVLLGLPWMTITTDLHPLYVRKIIEYEDKNFRPGREYVYPESTA